MEDKIIITSAEAKIFKEHLFKSLQKATDNFSNNVSFYKRDFDLYDKIKKLV